MEIAVTTLLAIPNSLLFRSIDFSKVRLGSWAMTFMALVSIYSLLSLVLGRVLLNIYFAWKCSERYWKRLFYAKAFAAVFLFWGDAFVIAFALIAARRDRSKQVHRDAYHWCGVANQLAISVLVILSVLTFVLFR
jgi:hypothetical protein